MARRCRPGAVLAIGLLMVSLVPTPSGLGAPVYVIDLLNPDGGEVLITGQPYQIKWTVTETGGAIHIGLSTDGGSNYTHVTSVPNTAGFFPRYDWRVPYIEDTSTCRIKLVWTETADPKSALYDDDESAGDFDISRGHWLDVKDIPDVMTHGRYYPVPWELLDPEGEIGSLDLEYRVDEGISWSAWTSAGARFTDVDPALGVVYWTPPNLNRTDAQVRLVARDVAGGAELRTAMSEVFEIRTAIVTLISPNGGEAFAQGGSVTVEWRVVEDPGELINGFGLFYTTDDGAHWTTVNGSIAPSYSYTWNVPPGGSTDRARVRVEAYYLEFSLLDSDESDGTFRILADPTDLSITLVDPNPPATGHYLETGTRYDVEWSITGSEGDITEFRVYYSVNSGATWNRIGVGDPADRTMEWLVPHAETLHGRVKVELVGTAGTLSAISNNDFPIYRRGTYNTPPVADAGEDRSVRSGTGFSLDGSGSFDGNGDPLTYSWTVLDDFGFNVTLTDPGTATPFFRANIGDYNLTIVVQLTVDDGGDLDPAWPFYTDRVSIRVEAAPPSITSVSPQYGWAGTNVTLEGDFPTGSTFYLDGVPMYTVPVNHTRGDPLTFALREGLPFGSYPIEVRNTRGSSFSADELEVHPAPDWLNGWGLKDHNPTDDVLTYPWLLWEDGTYKDCFGEDQVYTPFYVCIGLPWYDPWTGYSCIGYEYEESLFPDPLAALYYGVLFHHIASGGECYGMSATALQLYHTDAAPHLWNDSARFANELSIANDSEFDRRVDMMQGAQLSAEAMEWFLLRWLESLEPSFEFPLPPLGMGLFLNRVGTALRDHEFGIISMVADGVGHAVVPWKVVNMPYDDTVRIYVYDPNKEWWSTDQGTWDAFNDSRDTIHTPPYIEIEKTGDWWEWSYEFSDTLTIDDTTGLMFIPYSEVNGPRTLPTDWDSMSMFLVGDATSSLEDAIGNENHWTAGGDLVLEIPDSAPFAALMGANDGVDGWLLTNGTDFTTTIQGEPGGGEYDWMVAWNGTSAYAIKDAYVGGGSEDTVTMEYPGGNPMRGRMTYGTTDATKGYSYQHIKAMGAPGEDPKTRQRVYSILDATLHGDSLAIINTSDDYESLVFQNRGPHAVTIGVEFKTNVISSALLNRTGAPDHLPTASMNGIEVGPYEIVTITPSDWLDLDSADVLVERERPEIVPPGQVASFNAVSRLGTAHLTWTPPEDDGGANIDEYVIWRGPVYNEMNQLTAVTGDDRSYTDDTVVLGETYFYKIQAVNVAGPGRESPAVGVWVQQGPTRPSPPASGSAAVSGGAVRLTWEPPDDDGGGTITGYRVLRSDVGWASSPELLAEVGDVTSYTDDTVEGNSTYHYYLEAVNEAGPGNWYGPVEVFVPEGPGNGGGGGDGDDDDDDGGFTAYDLGVGTVLVAVAAGAGVLLGRRIGRKGL